MSIFASTAIARTGILAHQRAIQVTARNIANQSTEGYSRQRPVFTPIASVFEADGFPQGGGSRILKVDRIVDQGIQSQLERERSLLSYDRTLEVGISRIEGVLDELGGTGLSTGLNQFFDALNDLADAPGDPATREAAVQFGDNLVTQIRSVDLRLEQLETDTNQEISNTVDEVNEITLELRELNRQIRSREFGADGGSELRDRRNLLLEELGEKIDFTSFERDDGSLAIFVGGGALLVDGDARAELQVSTQQPVALADPTFFNIFVALNNTQQGPITQAISGGRIGALLDLRDDRIQDFRQQIDEFAFTLSDRINAVHLAGRGTVDANARNFFVDRNVAVAGTPPGTALSSVAGAAQSLGINPDLLADPRHVAAGLPAAGPAALGDNSNALALAAVQGTSQAVFQVGDPPGGPATGNVLSLNQFLSSQAGLLGAELRGLQARVASDELSVAELEDRRSSISGVSIDEEVTNLLRFQRGFEASARVLQTVDELLERLLSI